MLTPDKPGGNLLLAPDQHVSTAIQFSFRSTRSFSLAPAPDPSRHPARMAWFPRQSRYELGGMLSTLSRLVK